MGYNYTCSAVKSHVYTCNHEQSKTYIHGIMHLIKLNTTFVIMQHHNSVVYTLYIAVACRF